MERQPNIEVELDIFSGRPNPRWMMRADQVQDLANVSSQRQVLTPAEPPGLGYRGFIVHNLSGDRQIPATLHVYGGTISFTTGGRQVFVADEADLERQLLQDAAALGYGDLIQTFSGRPSSGDMTTAP